MTFAAYTRIGSTLHRLVECDTRARAEEIGRDVLDRTLGPMAPLAVVRTGDDPRPLLDKVERRSSRAG